MKPGLGCSTFLLVAVSFVTLPAAGQAPNLERMDLVLKSVPDGPVAKVQGVNIEAREFTDLYEEQIRLMARRSAAQPILDHERVQIGLQCLGMLVEREILYQEAQERKMTVTDPEIEDAWKRQLDILQKGFARGKDRVPSEEEVLKQAGTTREEALTELRKALLIEKSRAEIVKERGIAVSDTDVAQYYEANKERAKQPEQVHLKQIVVMGGAIPGAASPRSRDEARARAEDALRRIRAGHSFESVARAVSDGPERDKGGDLGPRAAWSLPAPFVAAARAMKPGEVSNVIEGTVGFHLIKLVEIISGSEVTLEEATPSIRRLLLAEKGAKAVKEFCRDIAEQPEAVEVYLQLDQQILAHPELAEQLGAG